MATPKIVVIGAGVVGLTTALKIQETGRYQVTIVAEVMPTDPKTPKYTSHWAGANHLFSLVPDSDAQHQLERDTLDVLWALSAPSSPAEYCFLRIQQTEYRDFPLPNPDPRQALCDSTVIPEAALPPGIVAGSTFPTLTIDTPTYLNYLAVRFRMAGGALVRGSVQHLSQAVRGGADLFAPDRAHLAAPPAAVLVCAGLGARSLCGVEDTALFPIRGQTVLLRAPWVRTGLTLARDGRTTYLIPRRGGNVIVGGTKDADDWYPVPRPETTRAILERAVAVCPELAPPPAEGSAARTPTVEDVLPIVIEEGCGLRPGRKGGIRLEVEWVAGAEAGRRVPVVHNYGHAGYGFQTSWGSAAVALRLLEEALTKDSE